MNARSLHAFRVIAYYLKEIKSQSQESFEIYIERTFPKKN
jgi:hypothetical protein